MIIMQVTGYNKALRALADLIGDVVTVNDGAENWVLWCLIDANQDGTTDPLADVVYSINTTGVYRIGPDGYIQYPAVVKVIGEVI